MITYDAENYDTILTVKIKVKNCSSIKSAKKKAYNFALTHHAELIKFCITDIYEI